MEGKPEINFGARCEYLTAIQEHWPELLRSLQEQPLAAFRKRLDKVPRSVAEGNLAALERSPCGELDELMAALGSWVEANQVRDRWIVEAAVQTLHHWALGGPIGKWLYHPKQLKSPRLEPHFGYWVPYFNSWREFQRGSHEIYRSALARYRSEVSTMWGTSKRNLSHQAVWTVLWQKGRSPAGIRRWHFRKAGKEVTEANIQIGVHAFAKAADLELRRPKAGRGAKKI